MKCDTCGIQIELKEKQSAFCGMIKIKLMDNDLHKQVNDKKDIPETNMPVIFHLKKTRIHKNL